MTHALSAPDLTGPLSLAKLEPPPIEHPVYLLGLAVGLVLGLFAMRARVDARKGPSAAWMAPAAPSFWRAALPVLALGVMGYISFLALFGAASPSTGEQRLGWAFVPLALLVIALLGTPIRALAGATSSTPRSTGRSSLIACVVVAAFGAVLSGLCSGYVLLTRLTGETSWLDKVRLLAPPMIAGALIAASFLALQRRGRPVAVWAISAGLVLACSAACLLGGSIALLQIGLGLACILVGLLIAAGFTGGSSLGPGTTLFLAGVLPALLVGARTFSELPAVAGLILACVPLAAFLTDLIVSHLAHRRGDSLARARWTGVVIVLIAALTAAAGVAAAFDSRLFNDQPTDEYSVNSSTP